MKVDAGGLGTPLLRARSKKQPLGPLYFATLLLAIAFCVSRLPALSLRFKELAIESGLDAAASAAAFGNMAALRSVAEFFATPMIAAWSDHAGRRPALILCAVAFCCEHTLLASSHSLSLLSVVHVLFGCFSDSHGALGHSCIADATSQDKRSVAFGRQFTMVGVAIIVGPVLGGELAARLGHNAPFVFAALLSAASILYMAAFLPEYLPVECTAIQKTQSGTKSPLQLFREVATLLAQTPELTWYMAATAMAQMGMGAFTSILPFWAHEALSWGAQDLGLFMSVNGVVIIVAHGCLLPLLERAAHGRERHLAQVCLVLSAAQMSAYGFASETGWVYVATVVGVGGSCGSTVLRGLVSRRVSQKQQGLIAGGSSALCAAAQTVGALVGSQALAMALRGGFTAGLPLQLCAVCLMISAICVAPARSAAALGTTKVTDADVPPEAFGM
mmetsp:Transcript_88146/g.247964  ORF Transcript_88146/g.247964 Transcript_88146/m.247964 type:complete len:446 (-) Transcript_88146:236-1573(-)